MDFGKNPLEVAKTSLNFLGGQADNDLIPICVQEKAIQVEVASRLRSFQSDCGFIQARGKPMEKTLFVHMGPAKTGSSAIQDFLGANERVLSDKGLHYSKALRWEKDGSHNPLAWILYHKYHNVHLDTHSKHFVEREEQLLQNLVDEIGANSDKSLILSSETFPMLGEEALDELLKLGGNRRVKAVFYVRDLREQAVSFAAQLVKEQISREFDNRLSNIFRNWIRHFNSTFIKCLELWKSKIGKESLIFRKYGYKYFKGWSIYSDFLDAIGLNLTEDFDLPDKLLNKSLKYCETIYSKDLLNRLTLETPQKVLADQLLSWEQCHKGTKFLLSKKESEQTIRKAEAIHRYLLDNYLDQSFEEMFSNPSSIYLGDEFSLSYSDFVDIVDHIDRNVNGFKQEFMESLTRALDRTYNYELRIRGFENIFQDSKNVAVWGSGDVSEKLFSKHNFLERIPLYIVDKNTKKQGSYFHGHKIHPPTIIPEKQIDTVIIATVAYFDEIREEIRSKYHQVKNILNNLLLAS